MKRGTGAQKEPPAKVSDDDALADKGFPLFAVGCAAACSFASTFGSTVIFPYMVSLVVCFDQHGAHGRTAIALIV